MDTRPRLTPAIANVRRAIRESFENPALLSAKRVILGVSGGADSMALALACAFELPKLNIEIHAVVVDHNLQPGSDQVAQEALARLRSLGIENAHSISIQVANSGQGPEAAARDARYQALEQKRVELGADFILTGHNLDDQAETVLLGLTRGSGLRSIAGMQLVDGQIVRPLLEISKSELRQACLDTGVSYWEDPHNQDSSFTRVRIRKLMELIDSELGPGVPAALARTAALASEADDYLTTGAQELIDEANAGNNGYLAEPLSKAHLALRRKALQLIAAGLVSGGVSRSQVEAIDQLITNWHGQKPMQLSGITVERVRDQILFKQSS